ncbi:unnamed protein product [Nesidiocoris tenuis]|uniref:Uncharacterized protein n=1 Tax=Nesidiocoris tenuis TaxID=355587 RepID=A0A6H5HR45_9HEMI|nr:unnamed protein product [Nesidiocoris tenuis]
MQWEKVRRVPTEALGGTGGGRVGGTPSRFPTSRRVLAKKPAFSASGLEKVPRDLKYPQKTAIAKCLETMRRPGRQRSVPIRWAMRTSSSHLRRSAFGRAALCMSLSIRHPRKLLINISNEIFTFKFDLNTTVTTRTVAGCFTVFGAVQWWLSLSGGE